MLQEHGKGQQAEYGSLDTLKVVIESQWSTDWGVSIGGYAVSRNQKISALDFTINDVTVEAREKFEKKELQEKYPDCSIFGFKTFIPRKTQHSISVKASDIDGQKFTSLDFVSDGRSPKIINRVLKSDSKDLIPKFINMVNEESLEVLELGSRAENNPGIRNRVNHGYVGLDYHPGPNVDIVGDAHKLRSLFPANRKFGAVFSQSVLEHLAMPWLIAREISGILKIGGLTCHRVPYMVGLHALPWDFYRYTTEGLRALFSPALGFEVIETSYVVNTSVYYKELPKADALHHVSPFSTGFLASYIIARKIKDVDLNRFSWEGDVSDIGEVYYPEKNQGVNKS